MDEATEAAIKASLLREVADELNSTDHATEAALGGIDYVIDWLRDLANDIDPN